MLEAVERVFYMLEILKRHTACAMGAVSAGGYALYARSRKGRVACVVGVGGRGRY